MKLRVDILVKCSINHQRLSIVSSIIVKRLKGFITKKKKKSSEFSS